METSDDPVTTAVVVGSVVAGGQMAKKAGGGGGYAMPRQMASQTAESLTDTQKTAESDNMKKRMAASLLTRDWNLSLSKPALLGVST